MNQLPMPMRFIARFSVLCGMLLLMTTLHLQGADDDIVQESHIEPFICALQERYQMATGQTLQLPANKAGTAAADYPGTGFYSGITVKQMSSIITTVITNCKTLAPMYLDYYDAAAPALACDIPDNATNEQAFEIASRALDRCRYLRLNPGSYLCNQGRVKGKVQQRDQGRSFGTDPLLHWDNGYLSHYVGNYNTYHNDYTVANDFLYALEYSAQSKALSGPWSSLDPTNIYAHYGFSLEYDFDSIRGNAVPLFSITAYSDEGFYPDGTVKLPNWSVPPPFWYGNSTPTKVEDPLSPWISDDRHQLGDIVTSNTFAYGGPMFMGDHLNRVGVSVSMSEIESMVERMARHITKDYFYEIDYQGLLLDVNFKYAVPDSAPMVVAGNYPGSCPSIGVIDSGLSLIDNGALAYYHDAWDYRSSGGGGGCASCGGMAGEEAGSPVEVSLGRMHRYRDLDWMASFGPGVFSTYDLRVKIYGQDQRARFFDPQQRAVCELAWTSADGMFHDGQGMSRGLALFDGSGQRVTDLALARQAELTLFDDRVLTFQLFAMEGADPATSALDGRLVRVADLAGKALVLTYRDPDPQAALQAVDADPARLWCFASAVDWRGIGMTFTWSQAAGQWVIASATIPGGGTIAYGYGANRLVSLNSITYPTDETSSFAVSWNAAQQWAELAISDAGAEGLHRQKTVSFTPSIEDGIAGGYAPQTPDLVRRVRNGLGEQSYRNWLEWDGSVMSVYTLTAGGPGGNGILRRLQYRNGVPIGTMVARTYIPDQEFASYEWVEESSFATDALMRPQTMTDPDGTFTTYERDEHGWILTQILHRADGSEISRQSTAYDAQGNPLVVTDTLHRVTRNAYDATGHLTKRTVAEGTSVEASWKYTYDAQGRVLTSVDANGNQTDYTYDPATGQLASIAEPADAPGGPRPTRHMTYDAGGRIHTSSDQAGRTTTYSYDGRGRPTVISYMDGSTEETVYGTGANANLVVRTKNRNNVWTDLSYDAGGRMVASVLAANAPEQQVSQWTYLPGKSVVATETVDGTRTAYDYDERGRIASVTAWSTATSMHVSTQANWDAERVSVSSDDKGRATFSLSSSDGLTSRTVREVIPGAVGTFIGTGTNAERAALLWQLPRPSGPNPSYTITESVSDVAGQVLIQTDPAGVSHQIGYDEQGRPTESSITDTVSGQVIRTKIEYDLQGNRRLVTHPSSFAPDAKGVVTTAYTYTGRNLLSTQTRSFAPNPGVTQPPLSVTTTTTYTLTGQRETRTDPRNPEWNDILHYGECCDRVTEAINPRGFSTQFTYDAEGRQTAITDANLHVTKTTYDARGRAVSVIGATGETNQTVYDNNLTDGVGLDADYAAYLTGLGFGPGAAGSATLIISPTNERTLVVRDGLGREVRRMFGTTTMQVASTTYDLPLVNGLEPIVQVDPKGGITTQYRDGEGRQVRTELPTGAVTAQVFDVRGNLISRTDAGGATSTMQYDDLGRIIRITDGEQSTTERTYDVAGHVVSETDGAHVAATSVYDGLGRKISETDRLQQTTNFEYDAAGDVTTITDAEGGVSRYAYSPTRQVEREELPDHSVTITTYDPIGQVSTLTDPRGVVTTYTYDKANRVASRQISTGATDKFEYDGAGRLIQATSGLYGTIISRVYSPDGLLTSETQQRPDGTASLSYVYDELRHPTQITLDDGTVIKAAYSPLGQVTSGSVNGSMLFTRTYDPAGRTQETIFANGLHESRAYNGVSQVLSQSVAPAPVAGIPGVKILDVGYAYDENHNKTTETDRVASGEQQAFSYDHGGRLTGWARTPGQIGGDRAKDQQDWTLSPVGDWKQTTVNGVTQARTHDAVHEVTTVAGATLAYDAAGNLTRDQHGRALAWDPDGRLVSSQTTDLDERVDGVVHYVYDALGRRLARTAFGRTTVFVLDGKQVVQERDQPRVVLAAEVAGDGTTSAANDPAPVGSLLDATGATHLNFQPASAPVPDGWLADKGRGEGVRTNGLTYGWQQALVAEHSFQRDAMPQSELDTLHVLSGADANNSWRIALANGTYAVVLIAGDPVSLVHTNDFTMNGVTLSDPDPYDPAADYGYQRGDFDGWAETITVSDGYLTLSAAPGASNPALCFIEIGPRGSQADDELRAKVVAAVAKATARTANGPLRRAPTPRTFVYGDDYVDAPVAMQLGTVTAAKSYFIHSNSLYSPQAVSDADGHVIERYSYTAYGERTVVGGYSGTTSAIGFAFGFTGLRDEAGLLFARNRYFSPDMGRWISRDSAGYVDGYSRYAGYFAPNAVDPDGQMAACPGEFGDMTPQDIVSSDNIAWFDAREELAPKYNAWAASFAAYRWMGVRVDKAAGLAEVIAEVAKGDASFNDPLSYFDPDFQVRLQAALDQYKSDLEYDAKIDQLYEMAYQELVPLLTGGFNPIGMAQGIVSGWVDDLVSPYADAAIDATGNAIYTAWNYYGFCFVADTLILTREGMKPIQDIKVGDLVVSANEGDVASIGLGVVERVHQNLAYDLALISIGGDVISGTLSHPFFIRGKGWVKLGNVKIGDEVLIRDGAFAKVDALHWVHLPKPQWVYNFEVQASHTYFVCGDATVGRDQFVLVHNGGGRPPSAKKLVAWLEKSLAGAATSTKRRIVSQAEKTLKDAKERVIKVNSAQGKAREKLVGEALEKRFPGWSVQSERYLRDAEKNIVKDSEGARRIDYVVIDNKGNVRYSLEVTSLRADKNIQLAKESRIRRDGGTYVRNRNTKQLVDISQVKTNVVRLP